MVAISDKFGKASSNTDYAVATTVKTTRVSGATVLEAFDLSKFATDAPVFFITYKKTTDPVTGIVSVTNQVSWKALVNSGANTLTNLTLAPGYTDTGNDPGDFIECVPTSYWENSLVDGILVSHNPDGSLKNNSVTTAAIADGAVTAAKIEPQEAWIPVTFKNGWVDFGGTANTCAYMKDSMGFVHIKGLMKSGVLNSIAFTLPAGYRPLAYARFPGMADGLFTSYDLPSSGDFTVSVAGNAFVVLDGITFKADN